MEKEAINADNKKDEINLDEKKEKIIYISISIVFVLLILVFIFSIPKLYEPSQIENNTVTRIIDGDTFEYYNGVEMVKVRLLCVDTPERLKKGYQEAKDYLSSLILYGDITLKSSTTDKDKYGRLLRYVYVNNDGNILFINKLIITNGYGELYIVPPETCAIMK